MTDNPNFQSLLAESGTFAVESMIVPVETRIAISAGNIMDHTTGTNADHSFYW